ncbi:MAG: Rieske (2Fe-2S) protein [Caulobacter sp.]|nr:Rieske (2Fe-2S) protein [Caulobacter sp.]
MTEPRCPLPIPFGWFALARSADLAPGQVETVQAFDTEIVLWRSEAGQARAFDPICRHLGAHLGGGKVTGERLECPFHNWRYDADGSVGEIPYAANVPIAARRPGCVKTWPLTEANNLIYVWRHPAGAEPLWAVEDFLPGGAAAWTLASQHDWTVGVHMQEITENGVDYPHFLFVHGVKSTPIPQWKIEGIRRHSVAKAAMETPRGLVEGQIEGNHIGPGQSAIRFTGISDVLLINSLTPIAREQTRARFDFYYPAHLDEGAAKGARAVARNVAFQFDQDKPIWEAKRYLKRPILCEADGPILAYRAQYAQYYVGGGEAVAAE